MVDNSDEKLLELIEKLKKMKMKEQFRDDMTALLTFLVELKSRREDY